MFTHKKEIARMQETIDALRRVCTLNDRALRIQDSQINNLEDKVGLLLRHMNLLFVPGQQEIKKIIHSPRLVRKTKHGKK